MTVPKPEPDRTICTDPDINAYQGYIPDDWGERVIGPIPAGTVLKRLLLDLAVTWRSVSYTAQMPANSIRAMHATAIGRSSYFTKNASIVAFSDQVINQLAERVPGLHGNRNLVNKLTEGLREIATGFRDRARKAKDRVSVEFMWADFMQEMAFRMSLWSSQRVAYVSFYNAYEAFLVDTLKVALDVASLRVTQKKEFNDALRNALGVDISVQCWSSKDVFIPRLVRHALSHNGGRVTSDLASHNHGIKLIGEALQILPADVHRMLKPLRGAVERIVGVTTDSPKFQASAAKLPHPQHEEGEQ